MHPIFSSWRMFALYLAGWVPLGAILGKLMAETGHLTTLQTVAVTVPPMIVLAFFCLSPWFTCRSAPLRSTRPGALASQHIAATVVVAGAVLLVARLAAGAFDNALPGLDSGFRAAAPVLTAMVAMIYAVSIAMHYVVIEAQASRRSELLAREAQFKALKAQVNPHFLFNSLNSISALTAIDAEGARAMCVRLAEFLRMSLRLGEHGTIPFREEMALTRMYLGVEQVRFGSKLRVREDLDPACDACRIPALLIQPLVENAVKHGIALLDEGGEITMRGKVEGERLRFTIGNPFDPDAPASHRSGIGLGKRVRQRCSKRATARRRAWKYRRGRDLITSR